MERGGLGAQRRIVRITLRRAAVERLAIRRIERAAAAQALDLEPHECMMVAAHTKDLMAAAALGLRTGHIARPNEHGPGRGETAPGEKVDFAAKNLEDLAGQLGT